MSENPGLLHENEICALVLIPANALFPMLLTELGIVTLVNPEQLKNVLPPMLVMELGSVRIPANPEQS